MDINTQNSSGMMNGMPPMNTGNGGPGEKKVGPIIGTLIIVLILIVAALYFFGQRLNTQNSVQQSTQTTQTSVGQNPTLSTTTESNDVQSLKSDLDNQLKNVDYSF